MNNQLLQPVKGTKDIFDEDIIIHNRIIAIAREIAINYGYSEIITPIFEKSEVFLRTLGETSDIVSKETYTFKDFDANITLRPEFTAGIVRAFISNGLTQSIPIKFFSSGPVFRRERPQKGRFRQFTQINYEFIDAKGSQSDIETIALAYTILKKLGLSEEITLEINTLGDLSSRKNYRAALVEYFEKYRNDLSEDSLVRLTKNPLRILDSKDEGDKKLIVNAPNMENYFSAESLAYFEQVLQGLTDLNINYKKNQRLVRGLDYYTHTVFEFTTDKLGSQGTVLAGGRYDGLIETMGGPNIPALGFAAGVERLAELIKDKNRKLETLASYYMVAIGEQAEKVAQKLMYELRFQGIIIYSDYQNNIGKKFKKANALGVEGCLILGEEELKNNTIKFKDMQSGEETLLSLGRLKEQLSEWEKLR